MSYGGPQRDEITLKPSNVWNLAEACLFVSNIQAMAYRCGFNIYMGGGVVNRGYSMTDLDLVAVARRKRTPRSARERVLDRLEDMGYAEAFREDLPMGHLRRLVRKEDNKQIDLVFVM